MSDKTLVIHPVVKAGNSSLRTPEAGLEEIKNLTAAISLDVVDARIVFLSEPKAGLFFGKGCAERIRDAIREKEVALAVVDTALSPVQQRNLEKLWQCKVIDRTALILEIFGDRARTREGVLQVELAHLTYQRSRLVRGWTHLERQRGGRGFLGGPGETQIELDRRVITDSIVRLKKELDDVRRTRAIHRAARRRVPFPVVALVGYTNAGKSTLFNRLTNADVFAKDMLFATLDPTMRLVRLPSGRKVILSDTVGFISDLPTELVAAFRATLEEVREAALILHVRDVAHPDAEAQKADVENVLRALGLSDRVDRGLTEVLNKTDLLDGETRRALSAASERRDKTFFVSALTGAGTEELLKGVDAFFDKDLTETEFAVPVADGAAVAAVYRRAEVVGRRDGDDFCFLRVRIGDADRARLLKDFPQIGQKG